MIGEVVGQYKITEKLGEGGMGAVYKGLDLMLQREVAVKMLRPEIARQPELVERFRAEAITLAKLNNPGIATLYNFFQHRDDYFMVMEFVSGRTLESTIRTSGAIPWERAVPLFIMILEGIQPAHSLNILHRDIKPANIMVTNWGAVKVMDFGIARVLGTARMTREGRMVGTIEYIAPERIKGNEADVRADIYSLGVVLYEMLSGRLPFESQSEFEIMRGHIQESPPPFARFVPGVPSPIEAVVMKSLAKAPEQRFQTCSEFIGALQNAMQYINSTRPRTDPNLAGVQNAHEDRSLKPTMMGEAGGVSNRLTDEAGIQPVFTGATAMDVSAPGALVSADPRPTRYEPQYQAPPFQTPQYQAPQYQAPQYQAPQYQAPQYQAPQYAPPGTPGQPHAAAAGQPLKPSPLQNLNWKHYTAAGGVLVLLVVGALFAFRGSHNGAAEQPGTKPPIADNPVVAPPIQSPYIPPVQADNPPKSTVPADKAGEVKPLDLPPVANTADSEEVKRAAARTREEAAARARAAEAKRKQQVEDLLNGK